MDTRPINGTLPDGNYEAQIFWTKEDDQKNRVGVGFNVYGANGEVVTRFGNWGRDLPFVRTMFAKFAGAVPNFNVESLKGKRVSVYLNTKEGRDQEVANFKPLEGASAKAAATTSKEDEEW
jgi:hypothetical protein